ncbi:hypothetical protein JZ751_029896 [Albula glossodonta]|uniref:CEP152 CEP63 binding coiled coil domain-containing protein n=1 Tax=Albula glossodonta TaxID=121402 RepID=A0A8T2NKV3_9TELE|nr:hypothetical protein JZ751_029896 [Albula glossodonta]
MTTTWQPCESSMRASLDSRTRDLEEQTELCQRLREQVKKVEREREEEKLERAGIINTLTKRLEESQQQCANLLQTGSAQENNHLRMQLQQAQSLKAINDNMNKSLQEELADLKEQITLYESGVRFGVISLDSNGEWENQLSDSYVDLGIKKANWRNSKFHSSPLSAVVADGSQSKEDMVAELKGELQRFLGSLKGKRKKISHLQEELQKAQSHAQDLRSQLDMAQKSVQDSKVRETCLEKHLETSSVGGVSQEELVKLQKEQQCLQEFVKTVERQKEELRRSEEKLKADNLELCTKMREMIQDFDQEKQEAAERYDRTQQQYRDDVVNRVRAELAQDHAAQVEELTAQSQLKIQHLESQLAEVSKEMLGVQECYITVCREKDSLEEKLRSKMEEERRSREEELKTQMGEEKARALEELKGALEKQHQTALASSRALWTQEHATELQQQVQSQLLQAKTAWQDEHSKATQSAMERVEKEWARRLEEVQGRGGSRRVSGGRGGRAQERGAQTEATDSTETLLTSQKLKLQQEADEARVRAVEEAVKRTEQELRDKHLADLTQQVESAVTRARSRWLEEMTSFPEYKARLQTERQEWEKRQAEVVAQQEAEARWLQTHLRKLKELEAESESKRAELREEAMSLRRLLEQRREEEAVALRAELARARASWGREKQEEMSRLQAQNEQDYRSFLEQHRAKLEQALAQAREEAERRSSELLQQREAGFQKLQRERQEEWSSQQERRSREERESFREEALVEVRAALEELQKLLGDGLERNEHNGVEGRSSSSPPKGALWTCVQAGGRDLISKAVAQAKQEWKKSGQGKPGRVSKELQDQRDVCQSPASQPCSSRSCTERVSRLQKQCQDLQRHLEKACRQLQQAVRENKASTQRLKEEHEAAIQKVQQENERKLEEARRASGESRDMLRYLQESKERAAAMIRQEVLRERRDTARKMRRYYLSCLQDLLKDAGTSQGAEKKIISAASKLAHMTKVLETPLSKRREGKTRSAHSTSKTKTTAAEDTPRRTLTSPSDPSQAGGHSLAHKQDAKGSEASANSDHKTGTGTLKTNAVTGQEGTKPTVTSPCQNSLKLMKNKSPEAFSKAPPPQLLSRPLEDGASCFSVCDITTANVTTRIHSRELFLSGGCPSQSEAACATGHTSKPFLIEEDPVRDEGSQSDWSSGALTRFEHLFPSVDQMNRKPFSLGSSHSTASISETDEDDDLTCFRTITTITKSDSGNCREASKVSGSRTRLGAALGATGHREPPSGSEGERLRRFCSKSLFSELKICQDSGFDSPLTVLHK